MIKINLSLLENVNPKSLNEIKRAKIQDKKKTNKNDDICRLSLK